MSFGRVVDQRGRGLPGPPAREVPRVVLDPVAVADLPEHLQVEQRPLLEPLRLEEAVPARGGRRRRSSSSTLTDSSGLLELLGRRHVVAGRVHGDPVHPLHRLRP